MAGANIGIGFLLSLHRGLSFRSKGRILRRAFGCFFFAAAAGGKRQN